MNKVAFLRSCILSGEVLSEKEAGDLDEWFAKIRLALAESSLSQNADSSAPTLPETSGLSVEPAEDRATKETRKLVLEAERHFDANNSAGRYDSGDKRNGFARFAASFYVTKTHERQWISVEERLPELGERVIAAAPERIEVLTREVHDDGEWWWIDDEGDTSTTAYLDYETNGESAITHWMPLPTAPESSSLVSRGAESVHSVKLNTADKSELLPTQLPKEK